MATPNQPPPGYRTPRFPSLNVETIHDSTEDRMYTLYYIRDIWVFTLTWTIIVYALFHLAVVLIAVATHGWRMSSWKYLWAVPIVYIGMAGLEALLSGSIVGVV